MQNKRPGGRDNLLKQNHPIQFKPQTKADFLALEISKAFNDEKQLPIYSIYCRNFNEAIVRRAFEDVTAVPDSKIKRSRLALFVYLVKKYANKED